MIDEFKNMEERLFTIEDIILLEEITEDHDDNDDNNNGASVAVALTAVMYCIYRYAQRKHKRS